MDINRIRLEELSELDQARLIGRAQADLDAIEPMVRDIVMDVRLRGDVALIEYAERFDGVTLTPDSLLVSEAEFAYAEDRVSDKVREAMIQAIQNIRSHHRQQMPVGTWMTEPSPGVLSGERITPIESVGLYVPRGKGSFPSVMMMLCVPAVLAAVPAIVVCTPPGPDGRMDPASLVAAKLCGVTTVFKLGGAQAIAALAFGTDHVPHVHKIVGPGSQYVMAAKRLVYGHVDPGPPTGPSESVILCDEHADAETAARELLVEAEHGADSAALLVTHSESLADRVRDLLGPLVAQLPSSRRQYCESVFTGYGGIVLTADLQQSIEFVNEYAPEHLRVLTADPFSLLYQIRNAGEVLLGENSSIPFGNFALGTNAILPTGGSARSYSCIGVCDFIKRSSFAYVSSGAVRTIGPLAVSLADYEGFPAHASAARYVMRQNDGR